MTNKIVDWSEPWGIVSDAHGNPFGLMACLEKLKAADAKQFFFLGDAVGYLPMEQQVFEILMDYGCHCITGNHDAMLLEQYPLDPNKDKVYGITAAKSRVSTTHKNWIASWPKQNEYLCPNTGEALLFVHGGPDDPWGQYIYADTELKLNKQYRAVFFGQTHYPFLRQLNETMVVNVGSCGLPRDVGNLASCVLYYPATNSAEILRVPFDVDEVLAGAKKISPIAEAVERCLRRNVLSR